MKRAVVIESEHLQRQVLRTILINEGLQVEEAADGQKGIVVIRDKPDIAMIFLANDLPGLSGIDTLIAIRKFQPKVPVIMLLAGEDRKTSQLALSRGAAWFLRKPVQVEHVLVVLRHITENLRLQSTIDHQVERLKLLEERVGEMARMEAEDLPAHEIIRESELLSKSIDIIASVLDAKKVSLMILSHDRKDLVMAKSNWILPSRIPHIRHPVSKGVSGRVAREGKPMLVKDITRHDRASTNEYTLQYESPSFIVSPIKLGERVIGVITVNDKQDKTPFTENDLAMLNTFSHQMSMSVANICNMKKTEREKLKLQFINGIVQSLVSSMDPVEIYSSLLGNIMTGLRATAGMLAFSDPKGAELLVEHVEPDSVRPPPSPFPLGSGILASVFKGKKVIIVNDVPENPEVDRGSDLLPGIEVTNMAVIPVRSDGKILGVIAVYNKEIGLDFDGWDKEILEAVAPQASMATKQAWLYQNLVKSIDDVVDTNRKLEEANKEIRNRIRELDRLKTKASQ